ncbi:MAG: hypothetical protein QF371_05335, partial [Flavobacteriales bacterium]|nr:hypothetical protein [Flavobacteriales bacterium]
MRFGTNEIERVRIKASGNVGIGTTSPGAKLEVTGQVKITGGTPGANKVLTSDAAGLATWETPTSTIFTNTSGVTSNENGTYASDDFVFGSPQLDDDGNATHDGRFFFDKSKGAFRAGLVQAGQWNDANLGSYSMAAGGNNIASGFSSVAMGNTTTSSGGYSVALGRQTTASGDYSLAMGWTTFAESVFETTIGSFNTDYTPTSTSAWSAGDRLFVVGNGTSNAARSNALTIYKNGTMNINDAYDMPTTDGTANQVMTTDGSGSVSWADAAGSSLIDSDADTKIQVEESTDEDKIRFDTGGTERMIIDDSGNVGVGIALPTRLFDVANASGAQMLLGRNGTTTTDDVLGELQFDGRSPAGGVSSVGASAFIRGTAAEPYGSDDKGAYMTFHTKAINTNSNAAATERMRIESDGTLTVADLAGSGSRMVIANALGDLSTQAIPINTDSQDLSSTSSGTNRTINISGGTGTTISVADNDNSASNEIQSLSISSNTISLSGGGGSVDVPSTRLSTIPLWNSETGTGYSMSNTSGADLSNCEAGFIPTTISSTGNIQVKVVLLVSSASGTNNFQLHSGSSYPITNTDTWTWTSTGGGRYVVESEWKSWSAGTTPRELRLNGWQSGGGATFTNAY